MEIKWSVVASFFCSFLLFSDVQSAMATKALSATAQDKAFPSDSRLDQDTHEDAGNSTYAAITDSDSILKSFRRAVEKQSTKRASAKKELAAADPLAAVLDAPPELVLIPTAEGYFMYDRLHGEPQRFRR